MGPSVQFFASALPCPCWFCWVRAWRLLSSSCPPPYVTPDAGREVMRLEPYLAHGRARPQPPAPARRVLHPLMLTSTLAEALSVQNSCGHTPLSTYKTSKCSLASPPHEAATHSLPCQPLEPPWPQNSEELFSRPLPAQELSGPGTQPAVPCRLLSKDWLCEE